MPSNLYTEARISLTRDGDLARALAAFEDWLKKDAAVGFRVLENIQREAHLVGEKGQFGDSTHLAEFLAVCATQHPVGSDDFECCKVYRGACASHHLHGLEIPRENVSAEWLLHYSVVDGEKAKVLVETMFSGWEEDLEDFQTATTSRELCRILEEALENWESAKVPQLPIDQRKFVWATFEAKGASLPRDPRAVIEALALPPKKPGPKAMLKLSYPTDKAENVRFPTVADAGWNNVFSPALEHVPDRGKPQTCYGWTMPLGPRDPQPEIVHTPPLWSDLQRPTVVGPI